MAEGQDPRAARIDELAADARLRHQGWDGYGADPLTDASIALAHTVLPTVPPEASVVPTQDGGIAFEWNRAGIPGTIEVWGADG